MLITHTPSQFKTTQLASFKFNPHTLAVCPPAASKAGPAIILALFRPCPAQCHQHGFPSPATDCGGLHQHRLDANVTHATGFGIDADDLTPEGQAELLRRLDRLGLEFYAWETYSHTPQAPRMRVVFPFDTPWAVPDPASWAQGLWPALVAHLGLNDVAAADPACKNVSRVYNLPRRPLADTAPRLHWYGRGARLKPVPYTAPRPAPTPTSAPNQDDAPDCVVAAATADLARFKPAIQGHNGSNQFYAAVCRLLVAYALPEHQAMPLLEAYNDRCEPPFSDLEVAHKVHDVQRKHVAGRTYEADPPTASRAWLSDFGERRRQAEAIAATPRAPNAEAQAVTSDDVDRVRYEFNRALTKGSRRSKRGVLLHAFLRAADPPPEAQRQALIDEACLLLGRAMTQAKVGPEHAQLMLNLILRPAVLRATQGTHPNDVV